MDCVLIISRKLNINPAVEIWTRTIQEKAATDKPPFFP